METIVSRDGTPITYARSGTGPPLVLVHGTMSSHGTWAPVLPTLEQLFTVFGVDRRGYGASGDSPDYAVGREFEDLAMLVDSLGDNVSLLGHSFGGLCALEAARLMAHLR
ncbi:MAG: alpha/beta hydrolase, partial [Anaerolineae bacterium]|nr:alpha/beta hydrolase [Anaerolineae bacterium]